MACHAGRPQTACTHVRHHAHTAFKLARFPLNFPQDDSAKQRGEYAVSELQERKDELVVAVAQLSSQLDR